MQVRIFSKSNPKKLENEINEWLSANPEIEVTRIEQVASGGSLASSVWLISIWYESK